MVKLAYFFSLGITFNKNKILNSIEHFAKLDFLDKSIKNKALDK